MFTTSNIMHIIPHSGNGGSPVLGKYCEHYQLHNGYYQDEIYRHIVASKFMQIYSIVISTEAAQENLCTPVYISAVYILIPTFVMLSVTGKLRSGSFKKLIGMQFTSRARLRLQPKLFIIIILRKLLCFRTVGWGKVSVSFSCDNGSFNRRRLTTFPEQHIIA